MTTGTQRVGGIAALIEAATFLVGLVMAVTVLADYTDEDASPRESVAFLIDNEVAYYVWNLVIFIIFGIFLVVLALALHERLKAGAPAIARTALAFGLIWAGLVLAAGMIANVGLETVVDLHGGHPVRAASVWSALDAVQNGLGGGIEVVGGLWVLLVSSAALQAQDLPRALNYLGVVIGVAGIVSVVPVPEAVLAVFGLGLIVWFAWLGIVMLRGDAAQHVPSDV